MLNLELNTKQSMAIAAKNSARRSAKIYAFRKSKSFKRKKRLNGALGSFRVAEFSASGEIGSIKVAQFSEAETSTIVELEAENSIYTHLPL